MSFLRKGILVSGGQICGVGLTMVAGIIFSRVLGREGMGQYELCRSVANSAGLVFSLGLGRACVYFINNRKVPMDQVTTNVVKVVFVTGPIILVGMLVAFRGFPNYFGEFSILTAFLIGLGTAAYSGALTFRPLLVAQLQARKLVVSDLSRSVVVLALGVALAYLGWLTPSTSLIVLALSFCVGLIMLVWFVGRHINLSLKMDWRLLGGTVFYGLKLGVATMMTGLAAQLTLMLLRYLRAGDFGEVGLYGRAVAISGFALLVPHALAPLLYSKFSATEGESRTRQVEMACRMNCAYGAVSALLIVFLGKYALRIMYGEEFVPAGQALIFLGPAVFLVPITGVMINLLSGDGRAILNVVLTGVPMVVAVLVSLVAVPTLGFRGSAIAVLCGNACGALTALGVCRKLYGVNPLRCWVVTSRDLKYVRKSLRG